MSRALLRIVSNLPRPGSTLISRCLGCMEGVVLLSEIHPRGAAIDERFEAASIVHAPGAAGQPHALRGGHRDDCAQMSAAGSR